MPDYLHRTSKAYLTSVSPSQLPEPIGNYIEDPDLSEVQGWQRVYWTINGDAVTLQTPAERDATDAAIAAALVASQKAEAEALYDELEAHSRTLRAIVVLLVDELNHLRTQWRDFQATVAASNNLAALKVGVAALPNLGDRTYQQARTTIINEIQSE